MSPKALALDKSGNIILAGYDAGDYLTAKFDPNGNLLWSARQSGRVGDIPLAPGITSAAVDDAGNVYVTGGLGGQRSYTETICFFDCVTYHLNASDDVTIKYSSTGHREWISSYSQKNNISYVGSAIAVDKAGNVFVTGTETIKYDPNGNQLFLTNAANSLILDAFTNFYVGSGGLTSKFDKDGRLLWSQPINGSVLKSDSLGNIIASSTSYTGPTVKLDPNGNILWSAPFGGQLAFDNAGNVCLASTYSAPSAYYPHYAALKLSGSGGLAWQSFNDNSGTVAAAATDASGNLYVTGQDNGGRNTVKYDPDGTRVWDMVSGGSALVVDPSGNFYVASSFGGFVLQKFSQVPSPGAPLIAPPPRHPLVRPGDDVTLHVEVAGTPTLNYQWNSTLGPIPDGTNADLTLTNVQSTQAGMYSVEVTNALGAAHSSEIYVSVLNPLASQTVVLGATATFFTPVAGGGPAGYQWQFNGSSLPGETRASLAVTNVGPSQVGDYTVVISNYYGNVLTSTVAHLYLDTHVTQSWAATVPGGNVGDVAQAVGVDSSGNVFVTGYTDCGHKTVKYSSSGHELWEVCDTNYGTLAGLAVDGAGNVCVAGGTFCTKYSPSGSIIWSSPFNDGAGSSNNVVAEITTDGSGNFYVSGTSASATNGADILTVKYNANGEQVWAARYDGAAHSDDLPNAVAVDGSGNVYVGGASAGALGYDFVAIKYSAAGNQLWAQGYHGPTSGNNVVARLTVDPAGSVYVTGWSPGDDYINDFATIKYDSSGAQRWVARYAGPGNGEDNPHGLGVDPSGNVYVTGSSVGDDHLYHIGTVKYASDGTQLWVQRYTGPANGNDYSRELALDTLGNIYIEGHSDSLRGPSPSTEVVTLSYDSSGNQRWAARYETGVELGNYYRNGSIQVDNSGTIYVADTTFTTGLPAYVTLKYVQALPSGPARLAIPVISAGQLRCALMGAPGAPYTIQTSSDLTHWTSLTNLVANAAGASEFTDSTAPGHKFYRAAQP
jgi:hypothetical protein